ncbi:signal recognition particle subunit srp68 [Lithohypha guttulata]|uniref:Signal recognition particle subunit SRP68 n=1 Tax=Lithohypha guttulata TaxID=1690604 RepID=A0AAN7T273_9EURO|nr:signal recognition particle subunit srp68 [Lithohypha guttulata]KAK5101642.1 signal recognition particle subunit srp68 [Lithohypha guttulata]
MNITQSIISGRDRALIGGDYSNYHTQSTRRIHTIRKRLGVTTPKGRKYTPKGPITPQDVAKNAEWVHLLLTSAERAWADAMHMKSSQSPENTQKPMPGATKRQIVSRFRRAIAYAANLVEVLEDQSTTNATNQDVLEAKAYMALLKGGLDFERNRWSSCIRHYSFIRLVYTALASQARSDLYRDLLEGTIDPSIRYAAYQEKLPRTKAVSDIAIENFPSEETQSRQDILNADASAFRTSAEEATAQSEGATDLPTSLDWRGRRVKLEDASISQALAAASAKETAIAQTYTSFQNGSTSAKDLAAGYDDIVNARQDAADATKIVIDELLAEGAGAGDSRIQGLQVTRTAVNYAVIAWRIGRNRVLCGDSDGLKLESHRPRRVQKDSKAANSKSLKEEPTGRKIARLREKVALYDSILQNLEAVKQLPGVIADTTFMDELDSKGAYFRALKCLAIGRSHAINGQVRNALALFARAQNLSQKVTSQAEASDVPKSDISATQLQAVQNYLTSLTLQYQALADLTSHSSKHSSQTKQYAPPLLERLHLNQYDDNVDLKNIVNYPPKLQPIPMKPLFFDLAWDYIQYPGQQATPLTTSTTTTSATATEEPKQAQAEEAPKKRGWFGFGR